MKTGTRLASAVCATEVMVVKGADVALECGGAPMVEAGAAGANGSIAAPDADGGTQLGKRYTHEETGLQVLCIKPGAGTLTVNGVPLVEVATKQLPSSD